MSYNNLIIFLTDRCRSGCPTCNVRAIPENTGMLQYSDLDLIFADPLVSGMAGKFIIWTGGEPFENFPVLEYGISISGEKGFRSEILSSGYWFRDMPGLLGKLREKGNFSLRISIDSEHLDFSGGDLLLKLIGECITESIELNFTVRDIPGSGESIVEILNKVKKNFPAYAAERKGDPRWIHHIPHVPVDEIDPYTYEDILSLNNSGCKMVFRDLVAGWDGNIYPCCGLFSLPGFEKYSTGSFTDRGLNESEYGNVRKLFSMIREKGPSGIIQEFGSNNAVGDIPEFRNQCHACLYLLRKYNEKIEFFLSG